MDRVLEICVDDLEGLEAAVEGGADRIELCSALSLGGLTPSPGLMVEAAATQIPVTAMIRPRSGGFEWCDRELAAMETEIVAASEAGLAGIVIGALDGDALDLSALRILTRAAEGLDITLHRCVDLLSDPLTAVDQAADLGISRILSSGGALRAADGIDRLKAMQDRAGERLVIMPGSGISPATLPALLTALDPVEVHASASAPAPTDAKLAKFGFQEACARRTDAATVAALRALLD
ncbi:copper homeostasis protein CutC [Pseudoruegeria sp. HB172150]|uniref:copper homeostasis protein CutC n=1 Tax=Pseudoruegeria sp. HB172150 TaxID=2721164 RepID=UPI001556F0FE|nr:copper homeostasis protein CutC [Pseudoruegeria sp. HB172150]